MFGKLIEKLKDLAKRPQVDPSQFDDPVALQTQWTPLKPGGTNFKTHTLVPAYGQRLEFRMAMAARIFCAVFFIPGVGILIGGIVLAVKGTEGIWPLLFMCAFGTVFGSVGGGMYRHYNKPIVFDKGCGSFWKGRRDPRTVLENPSPQDIVPLDDVYAIQLLAEYCRSDKSSYTSYEMNLVRTDGSRENVIDHGNAKRIRADARIVGDFLDVPV